MNRDNKISAIVLTKNEERNIETCLNSLKPASENIIVDDFSTDATITKSKNFKVKIIKHQWRNLVSQRRIGAQQAQGRWLLFVDADERITKSLWREIQEKISQNKTFNGFAMPRQNIVFGRALHYGGWYPDYQLRLIRKEQEGLLAIFGEKQISQLKNNGLIDCLQNPILHFSHQDLREWIKKYRRATTKEAEKFINTKCQPTLCYLIAMPFCKCWQQIISLRGYKDGLHGVMLGIYMFVFHLTVSIKYLVKKVLQAYKNE